MTHRAPSRAGGRRRRGFTILEILIVAAMISILSGIAMISVRTFFRSTQLRVVMGESYQIATALSLAYDDIGYYPKLNFLLHGLNEIGQSPGVPDTLANPLHRAFEYHNLDVSTRTSSALTLWSGPYMSMSQGRYTGQNLGAGPTIVTMRLPTSATAYDEVDYPADAWVQPYALYLMQIDDAGDVGFTNSIADFASVPNFFRAVVSYGPNLVPGGATVPSESNLPHDPEGRVPARLYTTDGDDLNPSDRTFTALVATQFNTDRRDAYYAVIDFDSDDLIKQF